MLKRVLNTITHPPFSGLIFAVWIYFCLCFVIHPGSTIRAGQFVDADDTLYMTQTLELLNGQGWYDRIEHRMDPLHGTEIHFSRFPQLLYALLIAPLRPILGEMSAALTAATIIPPLLLLGLFFVWRGQAKLFMPEKYANLSAFTGIFATFTIFQFMPGRIDHHGLVILLVMSATGCIMKMITTPENRQWPLYAGVLLAFSTAIALETLPWLLLLSLFLGVWSLVKGKQAAQAGLIFGAALTIASVFFLALYSPPSAWFRLDTLTYSFTYIILAGCITICFALAYAIRNACVLEWRLVFGLSATVIITAIFLNFFPELFKGPYGAIDPALKSFMLNNIEEAKPQITRLTAAQYLFTLLPLPLLALGIAFAQWRKSKAEQIWLWALSAFLIAAALTLATFFEARAIAMMHALCVVPLTCALYGILKKQSKRKAIAAFATIPILAILIPAYIYNASYYDTLLFPVQTGQAECDISAAASILKQPPHFTGTPKLILNSIEEGPALLLKTPHNILSAPYHMNVKGNLDAATFFRTADPDIAKAIAHRRKADFVVSCKYVSAAYLSEALAETDFDSERRFKMKAEPSFALQLGQGKIPDWLEPITVPQPSPILLFRVKK